MNEKYTQVDHMVEAGTLNWGNDRILALLCSGVQFVPTHTHLSQTGAQQYSICDIVGRSVTSNGEALGNPVIFPSVRQGPNFQVLVVKDDGNPDPWLLSYYDVDANGLPLQMNSNGTLIMRPTTTTDPPLVGVWMLL